jgi:hypothetical protein
LAGTDGAITSVCGAIASIATGAKLFTGSYWILG